MKTDPLQLIHRVRRSAWTLPLAAVAALVLFAINETAYDRSTASLESLGQRALARSQIQLVRRTLIDAETRQRGYLLSGRGEDLAPYQRSVQAARASLDWLNRHYAHDAEAAPVLADLTEHGMAKLSELDTTLKLHNRGTDTWRELVLTDIGREKMEALRTASQRLLDLETRRVERERAAVFGTLRAARVGVNVITVLSLAALVLFLRQTVAFQRAQHRHDEALRAERDRLEAEVATRTADLTDLARHLQTAREEEKSRLARELHDELGALLTAAKLDAARLKRLIDEVSPDARARLEHLSGAVNRGIELKRRIIEDLRPSSLANLGLVAALEILAREVAARAGLVVHTDLDEVALDEGAQITAYRLVQEALANVVRHAGATQATVLMRHAARDGLPGARLAVDDDGRGFDRAHWRGTTHGLMGLRYRVEAEGGHFEVDSTPGEGTRIAAWLPERAGAAEAEAA